VRIQDVTLVQPDITYEYASGGSNLDVIERNVKQFVAEQQGSAPKSSAPEKEKKLVIDNLYIKGARAHITAGFAEGKVITIPLPEIHLKDIGKKGGGATPAEVTREVISAVSKEATSAGAVIKNGVNGAVDAVKGFFK
jgi:hypothetical protein